MSSKKGSKLTERKVALCYVRQSYTRDDDDRNSPERQRANIQGFVERKGWLPSGTKTSADTNPPARKPTGPSGSR